MAETVDMGAEIIAGIREVFSTMLMIELEVAQVVEGRQETISSNITSMIGLGGGLRGVLAVHCPATVAREITGAFLGMAVEELNDDVKDAIGEIANMVAGNLKVACVAAGIPIELAIPTSIVGDSFHLSAIADARRVVVALEMAGHRFWVELMYVLTLHKGR
jgi:chemotaxis protein CheX